MFCPKCGKKADKDARFCGYCDYEFVNETSMIHGDSHEHENGKAFSEQKEEINKVDEEGFVRKLRDSVGILLWFIGGPISRISWELSSEFDVLVLCLWPVLAFLPYFGIKMYSSHDIETWKHSEHIKLWIYVGCLISGLVGIIVYYYLKGKERKYLAKTHIQSANSSILMPSCQECGNKVNEDDVYCKKCGTKLKEAEPSKTEIFAKESKRAYNKWIRGVSVIFGMFVLLSSISSGWPYYFESGLFSIFICEILLTPLSICLILLGLFPYYVNAKLSYWVDIESKYPEIVVGLIVVLFIILGVEPEPPESW